MVHIRYCTDDAECRKLWEKLWPKEDLFDLWPVRDCFHRAFGRPPLFIVWEENHRPKGLLALSGLDCGSSFVHFPGETWQGKTWLEQNRIIHYRPDMGWDLLNAVPGSAHIRYLISDPCPASHGHQADVDETGYLFYPGAHGFTFQNYMSLFSSKTRKKLKAELATLERGGVEIRHNRPSDVSLLFRMNLDVFANRSYFSDPRFLNGFESLVSFLFRNRMVRVTTVLIGGRVAAVDLGALYHGRYTLLAGGTDPEFKGVAKLINLHHIEWSCRQRLDQVDFLCGEFNWKTRFHLSPRPLYALQLPGNCAHAYLNKNFSHAMR